jgi:hypothetical protein
VAGETGTSCGTRAGTRCKSRTGTRCGTPAKTRTGTRSGTSCRARLVVAGLEGQLQGEIRAEEEGPTLRKISDFQGAGKAKEEGLCFD